MFLLGVITNFVKPAVLDRQKCLTTTDMVILEEVIIKYFLRKKQKWKQRFTWRWSVHH